MKVKSETIEPVKKFIPVKLEITIETADELCELWHRTNIGLGIVREGHMFGVSNEVAYPEKTTTTPLWITLNAKVIEQGLKQ